MTYENNWPIHSKCLWYLYHRAEAWKGPVEIGMLRTEYLGMYTNISVILSNGSNVYNIEMTYENNWPIHSKMFIVLISQG